MLQRTPLVQGLALLAGLLFAFLWSSKPGAWRLCDVNGRPVACRHVYSRGGGSRITFIDGKEMAFSMLEEDFPVSILRSDSGETWERDCCTHQGVVVYASREKMWQIVIPPN